MRRQFLRVDTFRYSRLGKGRKKLQKWRRPRGKHNKTRLNRAGYTVQPGIGFGSPRSSAGKIKGLVPVLVRNENDLKSLNKNNIIIIARTLGAKKKISIIKKASELNIQIHNVGGKK